MSNDNIKCFISYSHKDKSICDRFKTHLDALSRLYNISQWYDGRINPGGDIDKEILKNLKDSNVIFLLITPDFIASKYCYDIELENAIKRHKEGKCIVIPVICKDIVPGDYVFNCLKFVPTDGKPIKSFRPQDRGYIDAFIGISNLFKEYFNNDNKSLSKVNNKKTKNTANKTDVKIPIIKDGNLKSISLTQNLFDKTILYINEIQQFILKLEEITNKQLQMLSTLITSPRLTNGTLMAYGKNNLESYLIQIFSYIQQYFVGIDDTCVHFRFKKNDKYIKFSNIGYPIINLSTRPIAAKGGMIECSQKTSMPVVKSYNEDLHKKAHANEQIKRDYITFTFDSISKLYDMDISMCISIINKSKNKSRELLVPLLVLRIDRFIENFLIQYISSSMQLNPKWNLKDILNTEEE